MRNLVAKLGRHPFIRFGVIGGLGYLVNAAVLAFNTYVLHLDFAPAIGLAIFVSMCFTWIGNRYFTFRARRARGLSPMLQEWLKFMGANILGAVVNYCTALALVHFAAGIFANKFVAQACGVLAGLVFNFTLSSKMVFKESAGGRARLWRVHHRDWRIRLPQRRCLPEKPRQSVPRQRQRRRAL